MKSLVVEAVYPLNFREEESKKLGEHLRNRHSVDLIGMKRVGISNFLRFFLNHKDIAHTYIHPNAHDLFISVDLNDLVEIEANQFWLLTFKRIIDTLDRYEFESEVKKKLSDLFLEALKTKELFLTIDNIRTALNEIVSHDYLPTIFFLRFDRLKNIINTEFFSNLQGLKDGTSQKLAYVFTSFKGLNEISPEVFDKKNLSLFSHTLYVSPAKKDDMNIIFNTFVHRYNIVPGKDLTENILTISGGHVQYMHLAIIILNEKYKQQKVDFENLISILVSDERIVTQSEEIWESLDNESKQILLKIYKKESIQDEEKKRAKYLFDVGICTETNGEIEIFSPLFIYYIEHLNKQENKDKTIELSKKENALFVLFLDNIENIVEREKIISTVWPESADLGVSDWTIDRLISRLRTKLNQQNSDYSIVTVKTRGFKMTNSL